MKKASEQPVQEAGFKFQKIALRYDEKKMEVVNQLGGVICETLPSVMDEKYAANWKQRIVEMVAAWNERYLSKAYKPARFMATGAIDPIRDRDAREGTVNAFLEEYRVLCERYQLHIESDVNNSRLDLKPGADTQPIGYNIDRIF